MLGAFRLLALLLGLGLAAGAQAHEVRPGYLELQQTGTETWDVLWKVPARGDLQLAIAPAWPDNCALEGAPRRFATGGAATERSTIRCAGGLTGREVALSGLSATVIDVLARLPDLAEVRAAVANEWRAVRQEEANRAFYEGLRARYEVTVERPAWAAERPAPMAERR